MFKVTQILFSAIVLVAGVLNLAGCGQTGALYLPNPKPAAPQPAQGAGNATVSPTTSSTAP